MNITSIIIEANRWGKGYCSTIYDDYPAAIVYLSCNPQHLSIHTSILLDGDNYIPDTYMLTVADMKRRSLAPLKFVISEGYTYRRNYKRNMHLYDTLTDNYIKECLEYERVEHK